MLVGLEFDLAAKPGGFLGSGDLDLDLFLGGFDGSGGGRLPSGFDLPDPFGSDAALPFGQFFFFPAQSLPIRGPRQRLHWWERLAWQRP